MQLATDGEITAHLIIHTVILRTIILAGPPNSLYGLATVEIEFESETLPYTTAISNQYLIIGFFGPV